MSHTYFPTPPGPGFGREAAAAELSGEHWEALDRARAAVRRCAIPLAAISVFAALALTTPIAISLGIPWVIACLVTLILQVAASTGVHYLSEGTRTGTLTLR